MQEMTCTSCGMPLTDGEPHCSLCKQTMTCNVDNCSCQCGNMVKMEELKCDICLGM